MDATRKNTSVFLDRDFSHKERKDRKAGGPTSVSATIDRSGWKRVRLGDVLQVCHGKCQHAIESKTGKYPILATSGEIGRTDSYLYDGPSVLIGRKGTIDKPQYIDSPFWTIDTLFYTKIAEDYNPKFLYYLCLTIDWASMNEASGVPSLSANRIESLEVTIPDVDEQDKIANAITSIDTNISALQALITKYEANKKATVNLLLEPNKGWKWVRLGEIGSLMSGYPFASSSYIINGRYKVITIANVQDGKLVLTSDTNTIDELPSNLRPYQLLNEGDIIISMTGNVGRVCCVDKKDCLLNQRVGLFVIHRRDVINPGFLTLCLQAPRFQNTMISAGKGGAQPNIGNSDILNFEIYYPQVDEQKRIVAILDSIDGTINGLKSQLAKAQDIKQGMMSYFFG